MVKVNWLIDYDDETNPRSIYGTLDHAKEYALSHMDDHNDVVIRYQSDGMERCRFIDGEWKEPIFSLCK